MVDLFAHNYPDISRSRIWLIVLKISGFNLTIFEYVAIQIMLKTNTIFSSIFSLPCY